MISDNESPSHSAPSVEHYQAHHRALYVVIGVLLTLIVALLITVVYLINSNNTRFINSYEECVAAGYPILETYPEQCRTPNGQNFTRQISPTQDAVTPTAHALQSEVAIYFGKEPESLADFNNLYPVLRTTERVDLEMFAIEQLIKGPNESEQDEDYFAPVVLLGDSSCDTADFELTIDIPERTATLAFCKQVQTEGIGDEARAISSIERTLQQFGNIENVVILDKEGHCFADNSGIDLCLE